MYVYLTLSSFISLYTIYTIGEKMNISDSSIPYIVCTYLEVCTWKYVHNVYSGGNSGSSGWIRLLSAYTAIYTLSFIDPYLHIH